MTPLKLITKGRLFAASICIAGMFAGSATMADGGGGGHHSKSKLRFDGDPSFIDQGEALTAKFKLRGLDKKRDVKVSLTATAKVELICINPGGNIPPGAQPDPVVVKVSGEKVFAKKKIKFGKLTGEVTTDKVDNKAVGFYCPNPNWTQKIGEVRFIEAKLVAKQDKREAALVCTFDPPTSDGKVPAKYVKCVRH